MYPTEGKWRKHSLDTSNMVSNWAHCCMPVMEQENQEFKVSISYIVSSRVGWTACDKNLSKTNKQAKTE